MAAVSSCWVAVDTSLIAETTPETLLALRCVASVLTADWRLVSAALRLAVCPLQWSPAALVRLDRLDWTSCAAVLSWPAAPARGRMLVSFCTEARSAATSAHRVELDAEPQALRAGIQAAGIKSFGSLERLVNAYNTIYQYLKDNYDTPEKLKKYWGYLASNVVFIQITTEIGAALKIFETINERGLGLDSMDLLKNSLFTQVKPEEFTKLKNEWKKITAPLERDKEKPLRFLRYFLDQLRLTGMIGEGRCSDQT